MKSLVASAMIGTLFCASGIQAEECQPQSKIWPYEFVKDFEQGKIEVYADLLLENSCTNVKAESKFLTTGQIFGISNDLIDATATASIEKGVAATLKGELMVLGYVVADLERTEKTVQTLKDTISVPIDLSAKRTFLVGPVPVPVEYGVIGEGGLGYEASLAMMKADLKAKPFVKSQIFARASVDAKVAVIEAAGQITLINDQLDNQVSLAIQNYDFDTIYLKASGINNFDGLKGDITIKAKADIMGKPNGYRKELVSWNGFSQEDQLYLVDLAIPTM